MQIDHIVLWVSDMSRSVSFYSAFLGQPINQEEDHASWLVGQTKLFIGLSYIDKPLPFDKENIGLNHLAFHVSTLAELGEYESKLNMANIKHSGIQIDKYGGKEFIWFDDPDRIRLEFYLRLPLVPSN